MGAATSACTSVYLDPSASQIGKKESIADTARVLGRMFDGIEYRGFGQERVEELAEFAGVPVWNGLTTEFHPTQMIADVLTMEEEFGRGGMAGRKVTFMATRATTWATRSWWSAPSWASTSARADLPSRCPTPSS